MFANPTYPNLPDFVVFALNQGVPTADLPSPYTYAQWALSYAENVALSTPSDLPSIVYVIAVYNLAFHQLLKISPDQTNQTFFTDSRKTYNLLSFVTGPIASTNDVTTGNAMVVPEWMKNMTLQANDCIRTVWGLAYLDYAQCYGPTIVGVS